MSAVRADIDAVKSFRDDVRTYLDAQRSMLDAVERELSSTERMVAESVRRWQREVNRLTARARECYRRAAYVAQRGGYIDCSSWDRALAVAEARLARAIRAQTLVRNTAEKFREPQRKYQWYLNGDARRALLYLNAFITTLERVREERLEMSDAAGMAASIAVWVGGLPVEALASTDSPGMMPAEEKEGHIGGAQRRG